MYSVLHKCAPQSFLKVNIPSMILQTMALTQSQWKFVYFVFHIGLTGYLLVFKDNVWITAEIWYKVRDKCLKIDPVFNLAPFTTSIRIIVFSFTEIDYLTVFMLQNWQGYT